MTDHDAAVSGGQPGTASVPADPAPADPAPADPVLAGSSAVPGGPVAQPAGSPATAPRPRSPEPDPPAPAAGPAVSGEVLPRADAADMAGAITALSDPDLDKAGRRQALGRIVTHVRERGMGQLFKPSTAMRWVADAVGDVVPHLPVRDLATLRAHFPGLTEEAIAERLVRNAARATAAVGAVGGGVAAIEWVATPSLLTAPVLIAAETVAVVAVEIKLIGELHELYGAPVAGSVGQRSAALTMSWAKRRGINPMMPSVGMAAMLGTAARKELRDRLLRRFGKNLTSYGPMLTGAAVASFLNRRATIGLANGIRADLRRDRPRRQLPR